MAMIIDQSLCIIAMLFYVLGLLLFQSYRSEEGKMEHSEAACLTALQDVALVGLWFDHVVESHVNVLATFIALSFSDNS